MPLKDIFGKLKTTIVGTNTMDIDSKLDKVVNDITGYRTQVGRNSYIEIVKNLISKSALDIPQGFAQATTITPASMGQGSRLMRYKNYEAILASINYCHRALNVLVDNILSPDDITKTTLEINPNSFLEDSSSVDSDVRNVKELVKKLNLEKALNIIVKNTLSAGDFFCEIADAKTALTSKSAILTESYYENNRRFLESVTTTVDGKSVNVILDFTSYQEDKKVDKKEITIDDIHLLYYDAKRVVKLQSDMFPVCFGYLVFPATVLNPSLMVQNQMVNSICQNILSNLTKKIPDLNQDSINKDDLKDIIGSMIKESDPSRSMNVRFVPANKMQHFYVPSTKYYPYGESIFDAGAFTAKLIIALETALTIFRLNRSTEKRKIAVEIGLPRDARKAIEKLKEEFRKRKVSIDSFGTVDTIPSTITTFEDVYIPQKDGKSYVDISTFNEGMIDTRGKVDEIKLLRDALIAGLGVPPSFIGLEENMNAKATLTEENVLFARTIINNQQYFTQQVNELIQKIYEIVDPEKALTITDNVEISFPTPKSLQFERQAKYLSDLANLVQTLEGIGVPKEWSKKQYLTGIDWDEVKKYEIDDKTEKSLGITPDDQSAGGLGGMGGMGGMPSGGGMGF